MAAPCLLVGGVLCVWMPPNKKIWSFNFALITAAAALIILSVIFMAVDIKWLCCRLGDGHGGLPTRAGAHKPDGGGASGADSYGGVASIRLSPPQVRGGGSGAGGGSCRCCCCARRSAIDDDDSNPAGCCAECCDALSECACDARTAGCMANGCLAPIQWLGMNPLAVFIGMIVVEIFLIDTPGYVQCWGCAGLPADQSLGLTTVWDYIYWKGFWPWAGDPRGASMLVAVLHLVLWTVVAGILYARKIFIKL
jgi:predicted acyltransferase